MTVYIAGRQTGKTVFLIQQSARTGAVIVAPTYQMVGYIDRMARDLGLQIPPPITVADWIRGLVRQREGHGKTYLVDDLQMMLHQLNVEASTLDENYKEMVRMFGVKETCCTKCSHRERWYKQNYRVTFREIGCSGGFEVFMTMLLKHLADETDRTIKVNCNSD